MGEDEMGRMSEREAWLRPCLYCESDHDAGSFFHPMAALLREAAERGKKGREGGGGGGGGSKHKLGPGELRCDMCFGAFVCKDPLLLAVHQVRKTCASLIVVKCRCVIFTFSQSTIHSFRPPHGCPDCPWVVDSPTALALHRCEAHGKPCPLCPKEEEDKVKEENGNGECVGVTVRKKKTLTKYGRSESR